MYPKMNFSFYKPLNFSENTTLDGGSNVKRQKLRSYSDYFFERFYKLLSPNQELKKVLLDISHFTLCHFNSTINYEYIFLCKKLLIQTKKNYHQILSY